MNLAQPRVEEWRPPSDWRERLIRAYDEGVARGGPGCCGSTGVDHLPICSTGEGMSLRQWLTGTP
jgi:hypothetical protein